MASYVSALLWPRVAAPPSRAGHSCQRSYGPRLPTISRRCARVRQRTSRALGGKLIEISKRYRLDIWRSLRESKPSFQIEKPHHVWRVQILPWPTSLYGRFHSLDRRCRSRYAVGHALARRHLGLGQPSEVGGVDDSNQGTESFAPIRSRVLLQHLMHVANTVEKFQPAVEPEQHSLHSQDSVARLSRSRGHHGR